MQNSFMIQITFITILFCMLPSYSAIQNGQLFPDAITIINSSDTQINVAGATVQPEESHTIDVNPQGMLIVKQGKKQFLIEYPLYFPTNTRGETFHHVIIDFATLYWISTNGSPATNGIDQLDIENDTMYTISVRYYLTKSRSIAVTPLKLNSQEMNSKIVRDETGLQPYGLVEITDGHNKKYSVKIPRRMCLPHTSQNEWTTIKLCANTIALLHNGFHVTVK